MFEILLQPFINFQSLVNYEKIHGTLELFCDSFTTVWRGFCIQSLKYALNFPKAIAIKISKISTQKRKASGFEGSQFVKQNNVSGVENVV